MARLIWLAIFVGLGVVLYSSKPNNILTVYAFTVARGEIDLVEVLKENDRTWIEQALLEDFEFRVNDWGFLNHTRVIDISSNIDVGKCFGMAHHYLCVGRHSQQYRSGRAVLVNDSGDWSYLIGL